MKLNVKIEDQTFVVEVGDLNSRPVRVQVDGETFEVWPEAESTPHNGSSAVVSAPAGVTPPLRIIAHPVVAQATPNSAAAGAGKAVLAPIPGVIVSVAVKAGDAVVFGQELCVLEAMKMKNVIRANRAGTIAGVHAAAGDSVKHSQVLFDYSD